MNSWSVVCDWWKYALDKKGWISSPYVLRLKNGLKIHMRPKKKKPVADCDIFEEVFLDQTYPGMADIEEGVIIVDVGAQIGLFSLSAAHRGAKVLAFEPVQGNFAQLQKNVSANKLDITPVRMAVGAKQGTLSINISPSNEGGHSVLVKEKQGTVISVPSISLAGIFKKFQLKKIDILKLDCEGAEYDILLHTSFSTLKKIKKIFLELHAPIGIIVPKDELLTYLKKAGFVLNVHKEITYASEGKFWIITAHQSSEM